VLRKDRSTSAVLGWRQDAVIEERSVTLFAMTVPFYGQTTRSGYNVIVRIGRSMLRRYARRQEETASREVGVPARYQPTG
jgi:hypothetical protein